MTVKPDRPTVVLLHSSGGSPRQWQELVESLRHDWRVLAVEFHGHGQRPDKPTMTFADDAALAVPLLEMAGGAHVVGHSYGGAVAVKLASMRPQLVRSVVAYEPVLFRLLADDAAHPNYAIDVMRAVAAMRERLAGGRSARAAQLFVDFWSGAGAWHALSAASRQAMESRMPSIMRHFHALFAEPFPREQLARLPVPMLFLSGSRTVPAAHRIADHLRRALPLARHVELPGLGHMGPVTHAPVVNECIRDFLSTLTSDIR
jgi:pimeloyl-ACP methyl ester carboxylesterase